MPDADRGQRLAARARRGAAALAALAISGRHNALNALAALALATRCGCRRADVDALRIPGLPHRMQWVAEAGIRFVNDSKGTTVGATLAALDGLAGPVVLIAGGDGKGQDFAPLSAACAARCAPPCC